MFSADKTNAPAARALMDKVTVVVDPALEGLYQADHNQWPHRLEVELDDGTRLIQQMEYPFGDFNNPFTWDDAHTKFFAVTKGILPRTEAEELTRRIAALEELNDINDLFSLPCAAVV